MLTSKINTANQITIIINQILFHFFKALNLRKLINIILRIPHISKIIMSQIPETIFIHIIYSYNKSKQNLIQI